jgi:uncharacterized protein (TIGR02118 family)
MFKAMILLTRRDDMTHDDFRTWWLGEHAPLARGLPGLRKIAFNVIETVDADYDGITELWFDDQAAFEAAYASDFGKSVAADSLAHVSQRIRLFVDEHNVVVGD